MFIIKKYIKFLILLIFIYLCFFSINIFAENYNIGGDTTAGGNAGKYPYTFNGVGGNYQWAQDTSGIRKDILDKDGNILETRWRDGDWFAWTTADIATFTQITKDTELAPGFKWELDSSGNLIRDTDGNYLIRDILNDIPIKLTKDHFKDKSIEGFDSTYGTHYYKISHPVSEKRYCFNGISHPSGLPSGSLKNKNGDIFIYKGYSNLFEYVYKELNDNGLKTNTIRVFKEILKGEGLIVKKSLLGDFENYGVSLSTNYKFKLKSGNNYINVSGSDGIYEYSGISSNGDIMYVSADKEAIIKGLPNGEYSVEEIRNESDIFITEYDKESVIISNENQGESITIQNIFPFGTKLKVEKKAVGETVANGYETNMEFKYRIQNSEGKYITTIFSNGEYIYTGENYYGSEMKVSEINASIVKGLPYGTYYVEEIVPYSENDIYTVSYSPNIIELNKDNKESSVIIYNNFKIPNNYSYSITVNKNVIGKPNDTKNYSFIIQDSISKYYVQGNGQFGNGPSNFWVKANNSVEIKPSRAGVFIITETSDNDSFISEVNGNPLKLNFRNKNGTITITNIYDTIPSITPTPSNNNDTEGSYNYNHPDSVCKWKNPPDQIKEYKMSLVYIVENKRSNTEYTSNILLNRLNWNAEKLYNDPLTFFSYDYQSKENETDISLNIQARQVMIEKHTWFTLNPNWRDTYKDGVKHPSNSCRPLRSIWKNVPCDHPKPCTVEGCNGTKKALIGYERDGKCDHPNWIYPNPNTPQWIKHVGYKIIEAGSISQTKMYYKNIPVLSYTYFRPLNLGTNTNLSIDETRALIKTNSNISNQGIMGTINNYQNNPGVMKGVDNNYPIKFNIEFNNEQFGIPLSGTNGIKMEKGPDPPPEGVYDYDTQYYWGAKLYFSSNSLNFPKPITSLQYNNEEKLGTRYFIEDANSGFKGGTFYYRAIKASENNPFILGSNNSLRPFWSCEFNYGLRYRYGIEYTININTQSPVTPYYTESFNKKHKYPSKSNFESKFRGILVSWMPRNIHDVWTGELQGYINNQPILYGEFDIKTSGGF